MESLKKEKFIRTVLASARNMLANEIGGSGTIEAMVGAETWNIFISASKGHPEKYRNQWSQTTRVPVYVSTRITCKTGGKLFIYPITFWGAFYPRHIQRMTAKELSEKGYFIPSSCSADSKPFDDISPIYAERWDTELKTFLEEEVSKV